MMNAIRAILWQFLLRHVVAFASGWVCVLVIALTLALWPYPSVPFGLGVILMAIPLLHLTYYVAVFSFGCDSDLLSCDASYPTHMLRLPVPTRWLVLWPFMIGTLFMGAYWLTVVMIMMRPLQRMCEPYPVSMPEVLTLLVYISSLVWMQATLWSNYRHPLFRSLITLAALLVPLLFASGVLVSDLSYGTTYVVMSCGVLTALMFAIRNLNMARTGCETGWIPRRTAVKDSTDSKRMKPLEQEGQHRPSWRAKTTANWERVCAATVFSRPLIAQVWYEWRRYCVPIALFIIGAIVLMFTVCLKYPTASFPRTALLASPLYIASIASLSLGGLNHNVGDRHVSVFFASRPLTTLQFVIAKWIAAAICAALVCITAVCVVILAILVTEGASLLQDNWHAAREKFSVARLVFGGVMGLLVYIGLTWTLLVQVLPVRLSGRGWLETLVIGFFLTVGLFFAIGISVENSYLLPWAITLAFLAKFILAVTTFTALRSENMIPEGSGAELLFSWCLLVALVIATIFGFTQTLSPPLLLVLAPLVILVFPISRLTLAPIALHWNRHQ